MTTPDIVYLARAGQNEELRYSLRSLEVNAPDHGRVFVVGTKLPSWLTNVTLVPIDDLTNGAHNTRRKHQTMRRKARGILDRDDLAARFLLFNDDYYLMRPADRWTQWHLGDAQAWLEQRRTAAGWSPYLDDVQTTIDWVAGATGKPIYSRESHTPTMWSRRKLRDVLDTYPAARGLTIVDLYPLAGAGGVGRQGHNAKVHNDAQLAEKNLDRNPWLSSSDRSFRHRKVGQLIRETFPTPSRFERY